ncbi:hypothetical protein COCON_G00061280 [Conger conger]|uniref:Uncharacterized protein n=1 Tax=Conger conger TaxID=82655 RepID=A0A9Q1I1T0_CONCO|nr:hypothetical protein COCON_G00061280 [Conger conger]
MVVPGAAQVPAVLLRLGGADPGLRAGRSGPAVHHHQPVQRVAAGRGDGALPAGPGRAAEAAAQLRRAGHELRAQPTPHRDPEERRAVGPHGHPDHRPGASHLRHGAAQPGPGQRPAPAGPGPQRHVHLRSGAAGRRRGHRAGGGRLLRHGLPPGEGEARTEVGPARGRLHHLRPDERDPERDHLQHGQPHLRLGLGLFRPFRPRPRMKWLHPDPKGFWLWLRKLRKLRRFCRVLIGAQNNIIAVILIG